MRQRPGWAHANLCDRMPSGWCPRKAIGGQALARLMTSRGQTLAVAESCTGAASGRPWWPGPGASAYFLGGVQAYANAAKVALLGVPDAMIAAHGAVSEPVARAMAEGARQRLGADFGVSITGVAGPDGGSPESRSDSCSSPAPVRMGPSAWGTVSAGIAPAIWA